MIQGPQGWGDTVVTAQLYKALDLDNKGFTLVPSGSAAALDGAITKAYEQKQGFIAAYWAPTSLLAQYPMQRLSMAHDPEEWTRCTTVQDCPDPKPNYWQSSPELTVATKAFADRTDIPEVKDYLSTNVFIRESDTNQILTEHNIVSVDGLQISYFDFAAFKDKYFGYIITDKSKSTLMFITTASSVGTFTVPLPKNALQVGDYLAFPMFCSFNYSSDHTLHQMTCYAIPNLAGGKQLSIISQSQAVASNFAQITAEQKLGRIIVTLKMKNNATTVKNVAVYCVYQTDPSKGQSMVVGEYMNTVGTMNAGETKTVRFTNLTSGKSYKIYVIANGTWVVKALFPLSDIMPDM